MTTKCFFISQSLTDTHWWLRLCVGGVCVSLCVGDVCGYWERFYLYSCAWCRLQLLCTLCQTLQAVICHLLVLSGEFSRTNLRKYTLQKCVITAQCYVTLCRTRSEGQLVTIEFTCTCSSIIEQVLTRLPSMLISKLDRTWKKVHCTYNSGGTCFHNILIDQKHFYWELVFSVSVNTVKPSLRDL